MMKKVLNKIAKLTLLIVSIMLICLDFDVKVKAMDTTPQYSYLILDGQDLLSDAQEQEVMEYIYPILQYGNVIFQSTMLDKGDDYEGFCEDTYYDYFGNEPGIIFQIDMGNRKLTLSSSTELDDAIRHERDTIVDNVYRYATDEDYCRCVCRCFDEVYAVINDEAIAHSMKYIDNALIAIIISLIINFLIAFAGSKRKTSAGEIVAAMAVTTAFAGTAITKGILTKEYSPRSSGSGGSGGGGGGGGGGFSGGSSSHGF